MPPEGQHPKRLVVLLTQRAVVYEMVDCGRLLVQPPVADPREDVECYVKVMRQVGLWIVPSDAAAAGGA